LNIAVNTRLLLPNKLEGIGRFTFEVLKRITKSHPEIHFYFIFDRPHSDEFVFEKNIMPVVAPPKARHPVIFYYWFEYVIPKILKKDNNNLFLSPDGYLSLKTDIKSLAVIHDLNFIHRPKDLPFAVRKYYNHFFPMFAKKAARIATVSEYSKNDICQTLNISENKIDVVYNGVSDSFQIIDKNQKKKIREEYSFGEEYFIYVGSLHKRKNIPTLLKAFEEFKQENSGSLKLLIVGEKMFNDSDIEHVLKTLSCKNDVIFTGRLSDQELPLLIGSAFAMVFIPFFEGFGIPLLEAMACGIPIITSNVTSLPEIAGESALYADPYSVTSVAGQMKKLINDRKLYNEMINRGIERKNNFSWDKTASLLWQSIEKTMK